MPRINDLNLNNWQRYKDILTDSLWVIGARDKSGAHTGEYHGNFIPQIPNQLMRRFTKKGDVVLDTFLGSGTTLIECRRLGRHGVGIELIPEVAKRAKGHIVKQPLLAGKVFADISHAIKVVLSRSKLVAVEDVAYSMRAEKRRKK